jgi:uncharacterized protein VirK/YbjX
MWRLLYNHGVVVSRLTRGGAASTSLGWRSTTRYLRPYLGLSLDHVARRRVLLAQHDFLSRNFGPRLFADLSAPAQPLWRCASGGRQYAIWLTQVAEPHGEGDLALVFRLDDIVLYELSFTIGPDPTGSAGEDPSLLIARVQGARDRFEAIRLATRDCGDVAPAHLLLAAAEGLALAMSLPTIYGVSDDEQLARHNPYKEGCLFGYDAFWEALAGERIDGWYRFEAPILHKPLALVTVDHRRRSRRKRQLKEQLRDDVRTAFATRYRPPLALEPELSPFRPAWTPRRPVEWVLGASMPASTAPRPRSA